MGGSTGHGRTRRPTGAGHADQPGDGQDPDGPDPDGPDPDGQDPDGRAADGQAADGRPPEPDADPAVVARRICLATLEHAPRTRAELHSVLARKGVPEEVAQQVLTRFEAVGMIDDVLFASLWVASRHRGRGLAGPALSQELRRKGVEDQVVRTAVGELDPEQELATARALVARRLPATRRLAADARARRLLALLARKGYPAGTAFQVVREALAEEGLDADLLRHD